MESIVERGLVAIAERRAGDRDMHTCTFVVVVVMHRSCLLIYVYVHPFACLNSLKQPKEVLHVNGSERRRARLYESRPQFTVFSLRLPPVPVLFEISLTMSMTAVIVAPLPLISGRAGSRLPDALAPLLHWSGADGDYPTPTMSITKRYAGATAQVKNTRAPP